MIELHNVHKVLADRVVVDIETLRVKPGEIAAVVGAVGSGRQVLFDLLLSKIRPTAGTVLLAGHPPDDDAALSQNVGVLFAEDSLYRHLSVRANLAFQCRLYDLPRSRVDEVLDLVGLRDRARSRAGDLGSSLARRLALGRAIVHKPRVLLLTDPFARCDEPSISLMRGLIRQLTRRGGAVLILAADDAHLATLCDTIYTMQQGRITASVRPEQDERDLLPFKIPAKTQDKVVLIDPGDVLFALAQDGRAYLQTFVGRLPTQFTLTELEERLAPSGFFRAHRSYLVNLQHVKEVIPYTRNSFTLVLDDGHKTEVPLSKSAAGELRALLGY